MGYAAFVIVYYLTRNMIIEWVEVMLLLFRYIDVLCIVLLLNLVYGVIRRWALNIVSLLICQMKFSE